MKDMNSHGIEESLRFDELRSLLEHNCVSQMGKESVVDLRFLTDATMIESKLDEVVEMLELEKRGALLGGQSIPDAREVLQRSSISGSVLDPESLALLKTAIATYHQARKQLFDVGAEDFPLLHSKSGELGLFTDLEKLLVKSITRDGEVADTASHQLNVLRKEIIDEQEKLRRSIEGVLKHHQKEGRSDSEHLPTLRNGRLVIPVKSEYKRVVRGMIHGESATGQTSYVEPIELIDANNLVHELRSQEHREVTRILSDITSSVRDQLPDLHAMYLYLADLDVIRAKSRIAVSMNASKPKLVSGNDRVEYDTVRHPLLLLQHGIENVVPLSVELNSDDRIMIISGANAGGKSVALKTIGLLQYMLQVGMLVPVGEASKLRIFDNILSDIGDNQSIENDLSTYSAHLTHMKFFVANSTSKSLFLIDELGTGTEPEFGGAIAQAVLSKLNSNKAWGAVTTHYGNIKHMAEGTGGLFNASMSFDRELMKPTYRLEVGVPGSSYALEMATRIGLQKEVIENAERSLGGGKVDYEKFLGDLQIENKKLKDRLVKLESKEKEMEKSREEFIQLKSYLEDQRQKYVKEGRKEAENIVNQANRRVENLIADIKKAEADKEKTKELRKGFGEFKAVVESKAKTEQKVVSKGPKEVEIGDWVKLISNGMKGQVMTKNGNQLRVKVGEMLLEAKASDVEMSQAVKANKTSSSPSAQMYSLTDFNSELDVRGQRADEALKAVEDLIDKALLVGAGQIRILHGKGTGVLRNVIRQNLNDYKDVKSFESEHADRGGDGVTIIYFD